MPTRVSHVCCALPRLGLRGPGDLEADRNVVDRGLPGEQRLGLKQVAGLPVEAGQSGAENPRFAVRRRDQPGRHVEQRRLAAAGRPDDRDEFAVRDIQRGALDGLVGAAVGKPERHIDFFEGDGRRERACGTRTCGHASPL